MDHKPDLCDICRYDKPLSKFGEDAGWYTRILWLCAECADTCPNCGESFKADACICGEFDN